MAGKLHAKDLKKQDEFQQAGGALLDRAATWAHDNRTRIGLIVGAVVVLALAWSALALWSDARESESRERLAVALVAVEDAGEPGADVQSLLSDARTELEGLIAESPRTDAARLARYYLGVVLLRQGDAPEAAAQLDTFLEDESRSPMAPHALAVLAAAREELGEIDAARSALERLAEEEWELWPRDAALMDLARFHERQGRDAEADAIYRRLTEEEEFVESPYSRLARERLEG